MRKKLKLFRQLTLLFSYIEESLVFLDDDSYAESNSDPSAGTVDLHLTLPANPEYETTAQYGLVFAEATPDGQLRMVLEGMNRRGRIIRLEATAPSFTITEKRGRPSDYPGY